MAINATKIEFAGGSPGVVVTTGEEIYLLRPISGKHPDEWYIVTPGEDGADVITPTIFQATNPDDLLSKLNQVSATLTVTEIPLAGIPDLVVASAHQALL